MPTVVRPPGRLMPPAQEEINAAIRRLMAQPPDERRTQAYARLLAQWADACPQDSDRWTTAA